MVALSGYVADISAGPDDRAASTRQAAECARMWLDMSGETFTRLLSQVARAVPELARLYEIPLDERVIASTLEHAKEALVKVSLRSAHEAKEAQTGLTRALQRDSAAQHEQDAPSGLANRRELDEQLLKAFGSARELGRPLSVILCEVNELAGLCAVHGVRVRDELLSSVARELVRCARQLDVPARYDEERFAVVLPGTDRAGATLAAQRLRRMLDKLEVRLPDGRALPVSTSFGCATMDLLFRAESPAMLLREASACLFAEQSSLQRDARQR